MKVLDPVARLGHQHTDIDQRIHDAAEVIGASHTPVLQHSPRQQSVLLEGKVTAGKRELRPTDMPALGKPGLQVLDARQQEEIGALVVAIAAAAELFQDVGREPQLVHRAPAMARAGRALSA